MSKTYYCISQDLFQGLDKQGLIPPEDGGSMEKHKVSDKVKPVEKEHSQPKEDDEWIDFSDKHKFGNGRK